MSLFSSLSVALTGLNASQTAIDVTGQNISNANTEGYSRKQIDLQPLSRPDGTYGEMGMGVDVADITRIRDAFLDQQIQSQSGQQGYYTQVDAALGQVENLFNEPQNGSLNDNLNSFFSAWQDLANNPGDLSTREALSAAAGTLTDNLHGLTQGLQQYQSQQQGVLGDTVTQANNLMQQISALNKTISSEEAQPNGNANDSRDQRNQLVTQLSQLMDVTTTEDAQGRVSITSGGVLMVGPSSYQQLETYGTTVTQADGTQQPTFGVRLQSNKQVVQPATGQLKGILDVEQTIIPSYQDKLDSLAKGLVQSVNALHETGFNMNQDTGIDFFNPNDTTAGTISLSDAVLADPNNIAAASGGTTASATVSPAGGIPAQTAPTLDLKTIDPNYRYLVNGSVQITLDSNGQTLQEGAGKDYIVDYAQGTITFLNYNKFAAGDNITVNLRYAQNGFPGVGDGSNALAISQLAQQNSMAPDSSGNATQTFSDYYSSVVGDLGAARTQSTNGLQTQNNLVTQLQQEQTSVSGVSLDEEMTNLIKYQNSYQASARIVTTVQSMLDVLMNM